MSKLFQKFKTHAKQNKKPKSNVIKNIEVNEIFNLKTENRKSYSLMTTEWEQNTKHKADMSHHGNPSCHKDTASKGCEPEAAFSYGSANVLRQKAAAGEMRWECCGFTAWKKACFKLIYHSALV